VYAANRCARYKVNCNADCHHDQRRCGRGRIRISKPSRRGRCTTIQSLTKQPIKKVINTHFTGITGRATGVRKTPSRRRSRRQRADEGKPHAPDAGVGGIPYIESSRGASWRDREAPKDDIQKETDRPRTESRIETAASGGFPEELQNMLKPALPTRTVSTTTTLRDGRSRDPASRPGPRAHERRSLIYCRRRSRRTVTR